jgi:hypothetical protein
MSKKGPFEGISGAFWIFLYGMWQGPFDPSQRPFDPSPPLGNGRSIRDILAIRNMHMVALRLIFKHSKDI